MKSSLEERLQMGIVLGHGSADSTERVSILCATGGSNRSVAEVYVGCMLPIADGERHGLGNRATNQKNPTVARD